MTRSATAIVILAAAVAASCQSHPSQPPADRAQHIADAQALTRTYAQKAFEEWEVRGLAAGDDCDVLLVTTSIVMEDAMVDALHYGAGAYDLYDGGVQKFSRDRAFRAVAYRDASSKVWAYEALTPQEAERLTPCSE